MSRKSEVLVIFLSQRYFLETLEELCNYVYTLYKKALKMLSKFFACYAASLLFCYFWIIHDFYSRKKLIRHMLVQNDSGKKTTTLTWYLLRLLIASELCVGDSIARRQHNRRGESCANGMQSSRKRRARGRETHTVILLVNIHCVYYWCHDDVNVI